MNFIIGNSQQKEFFKKFISKLETELENEFVFIRDEETLLSKTKSLANSDLIIIEISINWNKKLLQEFYGLNIAKKLRRDFFIKSPIIFFSQLEKNYFDKKEFGLLDEEGSGFLSYPCCFKTIKDTLSRTNCLSDKALSKVVINNCNLNDEWETISHKIGALLLNYRNHRQEIISLTNKIFKTIEHFAPKHIENLNKFQNLLSSPIDSVDIKKIVAAKQKLDDGLKNKPSYFYGFSETDLEKLPRFPPKGYANVLIADDEPLDSLINSLQNEYRYTIVGQAQGAKEAERLLDEKKPDIVLSDYYFKKYSRDKTTDKKFGERFMMLATRFDVGSVKQPKKPIVAVISKTSLDKLDIPPDVLDFSGTSNATNAQFVHRGIWLEAIERGVTEPESIEGQNWTLEYQCRQRLEPYKADLPKLIRQWKLFKEIVQETLDLIRSISSSIDKESSELIFSIEKILKPFEQAKDFSIREVSEIFENIGKVHKKAKEPPESEIKTKIRNILHGKIEQFSSVTNHINLTLKIFSEVSTDLKSLPEYEKIGVEFEKKLHKFRDDNPLIPILRIFNKILNKSLNSLPEIPRLKKTVKAKNSFPQKIHVLIVEDDKSWTETVTSAVEIVKLKLGENFEVTHKHFDNTKEAIKAIPKKSQIPSQNESEEITKYIAVVDICLPDKSKKGQIPSPENGIKLIKALSEYTSNVPLIIFSTKASLEDRKVIGRLGIPDGKFIAKDYDAESALTEAITSLIEKKDKYVIRRLPYKKDGDLYYDFLINDLQIPLTTQLNLTFQALYDLREDQQFENQLLFSANEIYQKRLLLKGEKKTIKNNPIRFTTICTEFVS